MDRDRIAATAVTVLFVVFAAMTISQRYVVVDPWKLYVNTVRAYMAAGARGDSTALTRASLGTESVVYGGHVAEDGDVRTIYAAPRHPYTQLLLKAFPNVADEDQSLRAIPGTPPRLDAMPAGCRFAPRCPFAFDRCLVEVPPPYAQGDGHRAACFLVETDG